MAAEETWVVSRDATPKYAPQWTVYNEQTGERVATVFGSREVADRVATAMSPNSNKFEGETAEHWYKRARLLTLLLIEVKDQRDELLNLIGGGSQLTPPTHQP